MTKSLAELAASTRNEIEARAIQPPYKLAQRTIFKDLPDGRGNLFWANFQASTTDGATEQQLIDTAALFYTAGMAYRPMAKALQRAHDAIASLDADALGVSDEDTTHWYIRDEILSEIDAALKVVKGKQP